MKYKHLLLLASLSSMVLVQSCVTVPRIDKKDSRNNQFSSQLQDWMAIKHPQKIDTTAKIISSDTTMTESDSVYYGSILSKPNFNSGILIDTTKYQPYLDDSVKWIPLWLFRDTVVKNVIKTKIITIHDTVTIAVVNSTELNALKAYLQVSRDSTNKFILKYTQATSTSRARLIWIIILSLILAVGIYFTIKKGIL